MNITLKDGKIIEVKDGCRVKDVALQISDGLSRVALVAKVDGVLVDLNHILTTDCSLEILTFNDEEGREAYRHTASHILAQAVKNIYPTAKLAIGPAIKNGFYYDFDLTSPITLEDLSMIEKEMSAIIKADFLIARKKTTRKTALSKMQSFDEIYKMQLINELPPRSSITLYEQGDFVDLCAGPHLLSTGKVKYFKLTHLAGAYWKGSEKNKMLTRIYGTAFEKKSDLDAYLEKLEEAKKRDHNKLGRELGYFMTEENIGQGLPLLMPKGAQVMQTLIRFVEDEEAKRGYQLTRTPSMAKSNLYKISGHWDHYRDGMFVIGDEHLDNDVDILAMRPMTCPYQFMIYKNGLKSYRDLPVRYNETANLFRNENSGEMHGLIRVRQFTLSDGHIICTPEQLKSEFAACVDLIYYLLDCVGLREDVTYRFSKWDPNNKDKYIANAEAWEKSQVLMKDILDELKIDYIEADGEAAFYGPKLDVQINNVYGKEDTIITVQVDFALAERFEMDYVAEDGSRKTPYIIHRSSIGCYERTLALLIEKYAGALPLWLSPAQVTVMSLTDRTIGEADKMSVFLKENGIRSQSDNRNEKIGYKIREAQLAKTPYMVIIGDRDVEAGIVSVRHRKLGDLGTMTRDALLTRLKSEIDNKDCSK